MKVCVKTNYISCATDGKSLINFDTLPAFDGRTDTPPVTKSLSSSGRLKMRDMTSLDYTLFSCVLVSEFFTHN